MGPLSAPFENEVDEQWVSLIGLLSYILRIDFDWSFLNTTPQRKRIQASLSFSSKQFKPHCRQMIEMFSSQENVAKWRPVYKLYIKEKIRQS